jgi:hypothetical protein
MKNPVFPLFNEDGILLIQATGAQYNFLPGVSSSPSKCDDRFVLFSIQQDRI